MVQSLDLDLLFPGEEEHMRAGLTLGFTHCGSLVSQDS